MKDCLSDRSLWSVLEGEGTERERAHLADCRRCTSRSQRLTHDLSLLGRVLSDAPPLPVAVPHAGWTPVRWAAAAAVIVMGLMFGWMRGKAVLDPPAPVLADSMPVLETLAGEVFADSGFGSALGSSDATDLDALAVVSDDAVPCEWQPGGCDDDSTLF